MVKIWYNNYMSQLTEKQQRILKIILEYFHEYGKMPTLKEIALKADYTTPSSIQNYIKILLNNGYLIRGDGRHPFQLSYNLKPTINIPVIGSIACGKPMLAMENIEAYIPMDSAKLKGDPTNYFFLKAKGDSMNLTNIKGKSVDEGDFVLIKKQSCAKENDRVVALIGDDATLKRLKFEDNLPVLYPESNNSANKKIILLEDPLIQGVAIEVIKKKKE